jgi:hypothetical protein
VRAGGLATADGGEAEGLAGATPRVAERRHRIRRRSKTWSGRRRGRRSSI